MDVNSTIEKPSGKNVEVMVSGPGFCKLTLLLPSLAAEYVDALQSSFQDELCNETFSFLFMFSLSSKKTGTVLELWFVPDVSDEELNGSVAKIVGFCYSKKVAVKGVLTDYYPAPDRGFSASQLTAVLATLTRYRKE